MSSRKPIKVLMLEDNEDDVQFIERTMRKGDLSFIAEHVDTRDEFIDAISRFEPDVILSDHGLPQFNSREALSICMKMRAGTPFIIVTGTMSDEFATSCLHEGADDYILKSNLSRLPSAIIRAIKQRRIERLKREARHALRRQNAELTKVNRELDNFVYSISHNLRGPLASVLGLVRIAKMEDAEGRLSRIHGMIDASVLKLDVTLREILDFSRNERSDLLTVEVDWDQILRKSILQVQHLERAGSVEMKCDLKLMQPFFSDVHRLRAIFVNLLTNSVLYSDPRRKSVVDISVRTNADGADIRICDNGIGIEAKVLPKIFDMFYRGNERSQGAGLGLYITKEVVRKLEGTIDVTSKPREETVVQIHLKNFGPDRS